MDEQNKLVMSPSDLARAVEMARIVKAALEEAAEPRYADAVNRWFPIFTEELARASFAIYSRAGDRLKANYNEEEWEGIGRNIEKVLPATAAHDEAEDVTLVNEAKRLIRELLAREAQDGDVNNPWKLSDMVYVLEMLQWIGYEEEMDIVYQNNESDAGSDEEVVVSESTEGEEVMALEQADIDRLSSAVSEAVVNGLAEALARLMPQQATAEVDEPAAEVETTDVAEAEADAVPEVEAVAEEVVEEIAEADAEDEEVAAEVGDEEVVAEVGVEEADQDEAPAAEASLDSPLERAAREILNRTQESAEGSEDSASDDPLAAFLQQSLSAEASSSRSYKVSNAADKAALLNKYRTEAYGTLTKRVPLGVVAGFSATNENDQTALVESLLSIFIPD